MHKDHIKRIMICSGKGGVGKTTISIALSRALCELGEYVSLVDCDIDTPNVPDFMEIKQEVGIGEKIKPIVRDNLEIISIGFLLEEYDFISWPSERRGAAVQQLIDTVDWNNETKYMVIDTPPGTSDEIEYIVSAFNPDYIFVISTPHAASITDVKRTISMLKSYNPNISGVVMNMALMTCPECGVVIYKPDIPDFIDDIPVIATIDYTNTIVGCSMVDVSILVDIITGD